MSRVHEAMRHLEQKSATEKDPVAFSGNLMGALIGELAGEVPDDPNLESVRADLLAASRSYEQDKKKDLVLRFYLAMRSLLRANEMLQDRLRKAEQRNRAAEFVSIESGAEVRPAEPADPSNQSLGQHA
jgi:hypothetical protein